MPTLTSFSHRIGSAAIDQPKLVADLAKLVPTSFVDSYTEFICGSWRTCMLMNASGDSRDVVIRDYLGAPRVTDVGRQLSYLEEIMNEYFDQQWLRFARLARLGPGSVAVPHRDYVELKSDLVRIHVPLETGPEAYASEEQIIYRMGMGEIWFLDATRIHSIANFSTTNRTHLLLDFSAPDLASVLRAEEFDSSMPPESVVPRRHLRAGERETFMALSRVIDLTNLMDVLSMIIKRYFVAEMDVTDVFTWLTEIAEGSDDQQVLDRVRWLERHALTTR